MLALYKHTHIVCTSHYTTYLNQPLPLIRYMHLVPGSCRVWSMRPRFMQISHARQYRWQQLQQVQHNKLIEILVVSSNRSCLTDSSVPSDSCIHIYISQHIPISSSPANHYHHRCHRILWCSNGYLGSMLIGIFASSIHIYDYTVSKFRWVCRISCGADTYSTQLTYTYKRNPDWFFKTEQQIRSLLGVSIDNMGFPLYLLCINI